MLSVNDRTKRASGMGAEMHAMLRRLFPICRSITGPGTRETLAILSEDIDLDVVEVASGETVFGWTVPQEWHPRRADITGPDGRIHASFADNNLHLVNGSTAIDAKMSLEELLPHIYSLPEQPDLIPYVTSYYHPHWGFCMSEREKQALTPGTYEVRIDATHSDGALVYGEAALAGRSDQEILISTYICHPSMANDNLSGVVVAAALYRLLAARDDLFYTYRFLFTPETIGSLCWLKNNETTSVPRIRSGLVLSCLGDDGPFNYKRSRRGDAQIDRVASRLLGDDDTLHDFFPNSGSDERQFCSPGFDLPVGMLSRTYPGQWPYYHTSGDTVERLGPDILGCSLERVEILISGLEAAAAETYVRTEPRGEPMLSKYDLYHRQNLRRNTEADTERDYRGQMMWLLNLADGDHSLQDIAERSGGDLESLREIAGILEKVGLITPLVQSTPITGGPQTDNDRK